MKNLKTSSNYENAQNFYHSDEDSRPKARASMKKLSNARSSSSSSNEIVFLGEFPQENLNNQAFSYQEESKNIFEKNKSSEDKYTIKLSEGFTFVEFFDFKQFQSKFNEFSEIFEGNA